MCRQFQGERRVPSGGSVAYLVEDGRHAAPLGDHLAVRFSITAGESGDLLAGALDIHPLGDRGSIGEYHVGDRVGLDVFQSILRKRQFLVIPDRALHEDGVRGRAGVVQESGQR